MSPDTLFIAVSGGAFTLLLGVVGFFLRKLIGSVTTELTGTKNALHGLKNDFHSWQLKMEREFVRRDEYDDALEAIKKDNDFRRQMSLDMMKQINEISVAVARIEERTK